MKKRILFMSDLHCGNLVGLTPPKWQTNALQEELWCEYVNLCRQVGFCNIAVVNGDAVDGRGTKNGGRDLISQDRNIQCDIAEECLREVDTKSFLIIEGTAYHVGSEESWELTLARRLNAEFSQDKYLDINGTIFHARHFVPPSKLLHTRHTAPAREKMMSILQSEMLDFPKVNIIIRSHVHYLSYSGGVDWMAVTTPALQGFGSDYGRKISNGLVDFGMVWFDVEEDGEWKWNFSVAKITSQKPDVIKV